MAEDVQISGTDQMGKIRNPLGVVGLAIITIGIYGIVWYYKMNKEMAGIGASRNTDECGTSPGTSLAAVLIGWIIIVPPFVSTYRTCKRLNSCEKLVAGQEGMAAGLLWLIYLFISPIGMYIFQANMNKVLQAQAGGAPAAPAAAAPPAPPAPPAPAGLS